MLEGVTTGRIETEPNLIRHQVPIRLYESRRHPMSKAPSRHHFRTNAHCCCPNIPNSHPPTIATSNRHLRTSNRTALQTQSHLVESNKPRCSPRFDCPRYRDNQPLDNRLHLQSNRRHRQNCSRCLPHRKSLWHLDRNLRCCHHNPCHRIHSHC